MKIIISPAKKMNICTDELIETKIPVFIKEAEYIRNILRGMEYGELKRLWKCNDKIAELNMHRLKELELTTNLTPAILSYEGIQYQYMAPQVFSEKQWEYAAKHLRILSGLYGILAPEDGIIPYRLEMQAKLSGTFGNDLYDYWGDKIYRQLIKEEEIILNLASREYSKTIEKYLTDSTRFVNCVFGELVDGKIKVKGTKAKMARGEMVRWLAEENISTVEGVKSFTGLEYKYDEKRSASCELVFLQ